MRIVITGATGFIGRGLCARLAARGEEVIAVTRSPARAREILGNAVHCVGWDGSAAGEWAGSLDGAEAVINLAGESISGGRWSAGRKAAIVRSRVLAGQALVAALRAARNKPRAFVQASAVGYYGSRGDEELAEDSAAGDGFLAEVTCAWEASTEAVEGMGLRRVVVRSGVVLGREGGAFGRLLLPFRLYAGGPLGGGQQWFPWIHYEDEVGAILFLLGREEARGAYNLVAPGIVRNRELARLLGKAMHRPAFVPAPAPALRLLLGGMADELLLTSQRVVPRRLLEEGYAFRYPDAEAALRELV